MNRTPEPTNMQEMQELRNDLGAKNAIGGFTQEDVKAVQEKLSKQENRTEKNILDDALLLELHALAAAAHDQVGEYDGAHSFLDRWASEIRFEVASFLRKVKETAVEFPRHAGEKAHFLLQAGVAEYRLSKFDAARANLDDAKGLYGELLKRPDVSRQHKLAITNMFALCCYWFGCVETYANQFDDAEKHFVEGLSLVANACSEISLDARQASFAKYNTGRLLLGLGLLHYHKGALDLARANLLAAKVFLQRDSQDRARQLRVDLLLLSVERTEYVGAPDKEGEFRELIEKLEAMAKELEGLHGRYFLRVQSTIARVQVDLADLYKERTQQPGVAMEESRKAAALRQAEEALQAARNIVEEQRSRAYASENDKLQLDVIRIRTLRRMGEYDEAIHWGENVIRQPETRDHSLLHTEILFALGHAYYDRWKKAVSKADLENAEKYISRAGEAGKENPRAKAVCCLHLARIAHARGFHSEIQKQLNEWEKISQVIQLDWIRRFADKVQKEIRSDDSIVFSLQGLPSEKIYPIFEAKLKEFLLTRVISNNMPVEDAIKRLGISKQTYYNWKEQNPDRRRKPRKKRAERPVDTSSHDAGI
ncbi:MAG TPA: hypothetical protein VFF39_14940 [Verrucomicrobiae bacterium]|nr:hypothetical protein [Verrucomicrobiae bacterium]